MSAPTYQDLGAFMGRTVSETQGNMVLTIVTRAAYAYTRGEGFYRSNSLLVHLPFEFGDIVPADDICSVILTAAARLITNPSGLDRSESVGPQSAAWRGSFDGFSMGEQTTLNRYRRRAA